MSLCWKLVLLGLSNFKVIFFCAKEWFTIQEFSRFLFPFTHLQVLANVTFDTFVMSVLLTLIILHH